MKRTLKVILQKDVPELGKTGEIKTVAFGYAKNFLLPQRLASTANSNTLAQAAAVAKRRSAEEAAQQEREKKLKNRLGGFQLTVQGKANKAGKLYGSIRAEDILAQLRLAGITEVTPGMVHLSTPIETVGDHAVSIRLGEETVSIPLRVKPQ